MSTLILLRRFGVCWELLSEFSYNDNGMYFCLFAVFGKKEDKSEFHLKIKINNKRQQTRIYNQLYINWSK